MTAAPSTAEIAAANRPLLHDARRNLAYAKPLLRGWLHLLWFEASLVVGTLALMRAHGAVQLTVIAIYAATVTGMFGTSALYHRGNWQLCWSRRLQRADHAMIFLLIAGTATPAFVLAAPSPYGVVCVVTLWALTLAAILTRMLWMSAPEKLAGTIFLALGWTAGLAIPFVGARGDRPSVASHCRRVALHRGSVVLPPPPPQPGTHRLRVPRGLSRLRVRRGRLPVRGDHAVPHLTDGPTHHAASELRAARTSAPLEDHQ